MLDDLYCMLVALGGVHLCCICGIVVYKTDIYVYVQCEHGLL